MTSVRISTDHRLLPIFVAGLAFLIVIFAVVNLAAAHVVQVTTAIDIADVKSPHDFERALQAAVEDAANDAIAFEPAVVALTGMRIVGDRVLVGILFADEAGKQMLEGLAQGGGGETNEDMPVTPTATKIEI
jgi:hypothetical protein